MDKIWDRKSFEVICRRGGDEKPNDHAEPTKVERNFFIFLYLSGQKVLLYQLRSMQNKILLKDVL